MRTEWKIRIALIIVAVVSLGAVTAWFKAPTGKKEEKEVYNNIEEYQAPPKVYDVSTRAGFISELVDVYENITGGEIKLAKKKSLFTSENENINKAYEIGLISENDKAFYSDTEGVSAQDTGELCYKLMEIADSGYTLSQDESAHILNGEYNNSVLDEDGRSAYAFLVKYDIIVKNFNENPLMSLTKDNAQSIIDNFKNTFDANMIFYVDDKPVLIGESGDKLIEKFGNPNRIDKTEFGFEWYVYNGDYDKFMMVGVEKNRVCAFFSNSDKFTFGDVKSGADYKTVNNQTDGLSFIEDEQTNKVDAVYYNPYTAKTDIDEDVQHCRSEELFDFINAARVKKKQVMFIASDELMTDTYENSKQIMNTGAERGVSGQIASFEAKDIFSGYENMLSLRFADLWEFSPKALAYGGIGVYGGEKVHITVGVQEGNAVNIPQPQKVSPAKTEYQPIESGTAAVYSPVSGDCITAGENVKIVFSGVGAQKYHVEIQNCETRDFVVNADITGDLTEYDISADRFTEGVDYDMTVTGEYGGAETVNYFAEFSYGEPKPIEILSPTAEHDLTDINPNINIIWRSDVYTDFQIDLYNAKNQPVASSRVIDKSETEVTGLEAGKYMLRVSAMRRDSNIVKTYAETAFEITKEPTTTVVTGGAAGKRTSGSSSKRTGASFKSSNYSNVFGGKVAVYSSKAEADRNMRTITIPVWHLAGDGSKVSATARLTVNAAIADEVLEIFTKIYNSPEQFPIKSVGGYNWRNTATGSQSQHSYGTCIDINPNENYCIYRTGKKIGSFWKPGQNPYSMPEDGVVIQTFKAYGWTWGGEWNSLQDYMHFSYLGG